MNEPRSPLFRYAFGYSDEKPHCSFWVSIAVMVIFVLANTVTCSLAHAKAPSKEVAAANCLSKAAVWRQWGQEAHPKFRKTDQGRCWYAAGKALPQVAAKKKPLRFARAISPAPAIAAPAAEAPVEPVRVRTLSFRPIETFRPIDEGLMSPAETVRFRWWK